VDGTITALSVQASNAYRDLHCPSGKENLKMRTAGMLRCVIGQVVGRRFGDTSAFETSEDAFQTSSHIT